MPLNFYWCEIVDRCPPPPPPEIDSRGQRLTGCITCNLWTAGDAKGWTRLSVEDLRALHQLRHGGQIKVVIASFARAICARPFHLH